MLRTICTAVAIAIVGSASAEMGHVAQGRKNQDCGVYCLYVVLSALGKAPESVDELKSKMRQPDAKGYSLGQLADAAQFYGLHTLAVNTTPERLAVRSRPFCCIAHVDGDHFVLVSEIQNRITHVVDPPREYEIPVETLGTRWKGDALLISTSSLEAEEELKLPGSWGPWVLAAGAGIVFVWGAVVLGRRWAASN